jgi:HSP20 family protein
MTNAGASRSASCIAKSTGCSMNSWVQAGLRPPANGGIVMAPRMDMAETDDSIEITAELPGVDEKDLDVSVEGDVLVIKGEKKSESEEKKKDYHVVERSYGSFRRSIRLPGVVDPEKVKAAFDKGVLRVTLPKPQEAKQNRRRIEVKSAT